MESSALSSTPSSPLSFLDLDLSIHEQEIAPYGVSGPEEQPVIQVIQVSMLQESLFRYPSAPRPALIALPNEDETIISLNPLLSSAMSSNQLRRMTCDFLSLAVTECAFSAGKSQTATTPPTSKMIVRIEGLPTTGPVTIVVGDHGHKILSVRDVLFTVERAILRVSPAYEVNAIWRGLRQCPDELDVS